MGSLVNRGTKREPQWYIQFKDVDGKWKRRHAHQPTKEKAELVLRTIEGRVERGLVGVEERTPEKLARKTITIEQIARRFLGEVKGCAGYGPPKIKDLHSYRRDARSVFKARVLPVLGPLVAASVTPKDIERFRDQLRAGGLANASVTQTLAVLSKAYNWARSEDLIECANPVAGVERLRGTESKDFLDRAEVEALLDQAEKDAHAEGATLEARVRWPMVAVALYAGLRKGELFGLRWIDLNFDRASLEVERSYDLAPKNGEARSLRLHQELLPVLRRWKDQAPAAPGGVVFPVEPGAGLPLRMGNKNDDLGIVDLFTRAGCHPPADGKPWHMLRRTWASHAVMAGVNLYAVQKMGGWRTPSMVQRYAKLSPDYLAGEVARMSFAPATPADVADLARERERRG